MPASTAIRRLAQLAMETTGLIGPYYRWLERHAARQPTPSVDDGHPMSSRELITVVSGTPNSAWFSESGQADAAKFLALAAKHGLTACVGLDVLDLGCGSGRIARWLANDIVASGGTFCGSDINPILVAWCAKHLPGRYFVNQLKPPLGLPASSKDLVYAHSVLTHLTEPRTIAWLQEISRILRKNGRAILTFHDETYADKWGPSEIGRRLRNERYLVWNNALEGSNCMSAWTTRAYFRELVEPTFEVLEIIPGGQEMPNQAIAIIANRSV